MTDTQGTYQPLAYMGVVGKVELRGGGRLKVGGYFMTGIMSI